VCARSVCARSVCARPIRIGAGDADLIRGKRNRAHSAVLAGVLVGVREQLFAGGSPQFPQCHAGPALPRTGSQSAAVFGPDLGPPRRLRFNQRLKVFRWGAELSISERPALHG
jgi:hypothetical protein